jgi:hypothetical protein
MGMESVTRSVDGGLCHHPWQCGEEQGISFSCDGAEDVDRCIGIGTSPMMIPHCCMQGERSMFPHGAACKREIGADLNYGGKLLMFRKPPVTTTAQ